MNVLVTDRQPKAVAWLGAEKGGGGGTNFFSLKVKSKNKTKNRSQCHSGIKPQDRVAWLGSLYIDIYFQLTLLNIQSLLMF